jgi:hypothetical protein
LRRMIIRALRSIALLDITILTLTISNINFALKPAVEGFATIHICI